MNVVDLHQRACDRFGQQVRAVPGDRWHATTPCADWDVRTLVNHVVAEDLWTPPLLAGATIAEIGDRFDGDVLGADPVAAYARAAADATAAAHTDGVLQRTVHLSYGDAPAEEYLWQMFADHLIHGWDLARAIGADAHLDEDLVEACERWFRGYEEAYRSGGAIGPRPDLPAAADPQTRLLAAFGRTTSVG